MSLPTGERQCIHLVVIGRAPRLPGRVRPGELRHPTTSGTSGVRLRPLAVEQGLLLAPFVFRPLFQASYFPNRSIAFRPLMKSSRTSSECSGQPKLKRRRAPWLKRKRQGEWPARADAQRALNTEARQRDDRTGAQRAKSNASSAPQPALCVCKQAPRYR